ncbi:phosphate--AMP phosphotransferase [Salinicoccus siamensis]|uniref:Phosphate--AMP phosphotransferase n=1 Tax=Salinicoccus siamensis TaxID=381830 RepID=A0ABV5Z7I7_9STAP
MAGFDEALENRLGELTRETKKRGIPLMIVIEGPPASGKSRLANALYMALDAKYTNFMATRPPRDIDLRYPFLQRFWNHLPKSGDINIHFRSWYAQYINYKSYGIKENVRTEYADIRQDMENFEQMLTDGGYEIIKLYIDAPEAVRARHIQKLKDNPILKWKAEEFEEQLDKTDYLKEMNQFLDTPTGSPWEVIDFEDKEGAVNTLFSTVVKRLEARLEREDQTQEEVVDGDFTEDYEAEFFDFNFEDEKISRKDYKAILPDLQSRMREIQFQLYKEKVPLILVYEGMDAAGKGGNIKRIREHLDPTGYTVNATGAPTDVELRHHYLWRFAAGLPRSGHVAFYDRSWYGRVLVERIEGLASTQEWQQSYEEIKAFEKSLYNSGAIIIKFFLSLDKDEQLERFESREDDPAKQWKLTDEDWRNREKWDEYVEASEDMIRKTHIAFAPWHVIPGNNKKYARITALKKVIETCEARLGSDAKPGD